MHTTNRARLDEIVGSGKLEAPVSGGASWSYTGTLRAGDVAIRLKPSRRSFVKLVPSTDGFGQVPHYYPGGVGNGPSFSYIPIEYLEYFNVTIGKWLPLAR